MVTVSAPLVDEQHEDCRALRRDPVGAALWPHVVRAHQGLLAVQRIGLTPERLQEISALEVALDDRHDDLIRSVWYRFIAEEHAMAQSDAKERVQQFRVKLLPDGLQSTRKSYRDEAGQAELLRSRLSGDDWAQLQTMSVLSGGSLADVVREWLDSAAKLGELEYERSGDPEQVSPSAREVLGARNEWIRVIRLVRDALEMSDELSDELRDVLDRIDYVVEQARRRAARNSAPANDSGAADSGAADSGVALVTTAAGDAATEPAGLEGARSHSHPAAEVA